MKIKNDIIYPIFLECCQYEKEVFWINIFEDLSYGIPPYGTYINKDFLCCNYKNKEFSYKIEVNKDSKILYTDVYNLLTNKLGMLSNDAKIKKKVDFYNIENLIFKSRKTWNNIRKKNIKDLLIEKYVIDMKNKHSLTIQQSKYLLSVIFTAIIFKAITSKDIIYNNGIIENIEGIEFNKKQIIVKKDIYNINNNIPNNVILGKPIMSDNWIQYLKDIEKLYK